MVIYKKNGLYKGINTNKLLLTISYIIIIMLFKLIPNKNINNNKFVKEIQKYFLEYNKVNINEVEKKMYKNNVVFNNIKSIINIGFTLDTNYILPTMMTVSSIMASQKKTTKIRFHFGVTNNFTSKFMLKLYNLKNRLNNLTEFNFYYLKEAVEKMKNFHPKGEACPGKFELPQLLPNNVKRLIIFDAGDILILRDLSELYNYDMKNYWALGPPEPRCIPFVRRLNLTKYINIGSILLNVEEFKKNHFWDFYVKNRDITKGGQPDQTLFNLLLPDDKKNFFPFRFGIPSIISNDESSDKLKFINFNFPRWFNSSLSNLQPENPKSEKGILAQTYNPLFIHQYNEKWAKGSGLSIYRHLSKYFIYLAGIKEELCNSFPGYCL